MSGALRIAAALVATLVVGLSSTSLAADDLDSAKRAGQVGERFDGYLGVVDAAAPVRIKALVENINTKRRKAYKKLADRNKVELEVIQGVAGTKAIERTKNGQFVMPSDSDSWQKR